MRSVNLRLWLLAVLTVAVGSWWQLPSLSADAPDPALRIVYGAGASKHFQLGNVSGNVTPPQPLLAAGAHALDAAVGAEHTLIVSEDGRVLVTGHNQRAQLGIPVAATATPTLIPGLNNIVKVAAGAYHSFALDTGGNLWGWGYDAQGQVGVGSGNHVGDSVPTPTQLALTGVVDIAAGDDFSIALTSDGQLWTWGSNQAFQLGDNSPPRNVPGSVSAGPVTTFQRVAAGGRTALAMTTGGSVFGWGSNSSKQIVNSTAATVPLTLMSVGGTAREIAVGDQHTLIALSTGAVRARGLGSSGQIGWSTYNNSPDFVTVPGLSNVVDVAAGASHSIAITANGGIWTWGANAFGQLGFKSANATVPAPAQVTGVPSTALTADAHGATSLFLHAPGQVGVTFNVPVNASCTQPLNASVALTGYNVVSVTPADIVLVLDESGSIGSVDFAKLKDFAIDFVSAQDIGPNRSRVGVVMFATGSRVVINLSDNKQTIINAIANTSYGQGYTCIGCGIDEADTMLDTFGRSGADRIMVVVTDGQSTASIDDNFAAIVTTAHQSSTVFAIGVGSQILASQIEFIASDIPSVQTAFFTADFAGLSQVVSQLGVNVTPAIANLIATFTVAPTFAINGPGTVTSGNLSVNANQLTWFVPALGATPISLNFPLRGAGVGGKLPIFSSVSYQVKGETFEVTGPTIDVVGCPASVILNPPNATHLVGQVHVGNVTVLDSFGAVLHVPTVVNVTVGPNAGRSFNVSGGAAAFSYSSNQSGIDELVARVPGSPILSQPATVAWELPNSPPSVNVTPDRTIALNGSPTATFTVVGFAADDGQLLPLEIEWSESGVPLGKDSSLKLTRGAGVYTFTFTAFDGQFSASRSTTVTITDPTAPVITAQTTGTEGESGWHITPVALTWVVDDPESAFTTTGCSPKTFSADGGNQHAACSATSAGGSSNASATFNIDTTPPVVTAPAAKTAEATSVNGAKVSYEGENATDTTSGIVSFACAPASNTVFAIGTTPINCTATDAAGHKSSAASAVTVSDTTPPDLADIPDISEAGTDPGGKAISWTTSATDAVGPVTTNCLPASGSTFGYGTTAVACTATDAYHNKDVETFSVTVTDATPPEVSETVNGTQGLNDWFTSDVTVEFLVADPQSAIVNSTGCAPATVSTDGAASFTCTATSAGGTTTRTASVKRDATAPVLGLPPNITTQATGSGGAAVLFAFTPADTTSGLASSSCSHASGSTFPIGVTTVTCSAADQAGNNAAGSFTITVGDTIPPIIASSTPSITTVNSSNHQMIPITVSVSATDNIAPPPVCAIVSVSSNEPQNGTGDGDTPNDWLITGPLTVQLRAERSGNGNGRVYTITVQCVDGAGNTATSTATVSVPKGKK